MLTVRVQLDEKRVAPSLGDFSFSSSSTCDAILHRHRMSLQRNIATGYDLFNGLLAPDPRFERQSRLSPCSAPSGRWEPCQLAAGAIGSPSRAAPSAAKPSRFRLLADPLTLGVGHEFPEGRRADRKPASPPWRRLFASARQPGSSRCASSSFSATSSGSSRPRSAVANGLTSSSATICHRNQMSTPCLMGTS